MIMPLDKLHGMWQNNVLARGTRVKCPGYPSNRDVRNDFRYDVCYVVHNEIY